MVIYGVLSKGEAKKVPGLPSHSGASSFDSKGEIITSVHGNAAVFAVVRGIRSPLLSTPQTDETGDSGR